MHSHKLILCNNNCKRNTADPTMYGPKPNLGNCSCKKYSRPKKAWPWHRYPLKSGAGDNCCMKLPFAASVHEHLSPCYNIVSWIPSKINHMWSLWTLSLNKRSLELVTVWLTFLFYSSVSSLFLVFLLTEVQIGTDKKDNADRTSIQMVCVSQNLSWFYFIGGYELYLYHHDTDSQVNHSDIACP